MILGGQKIPTIIRLRSYFELVSGSPLWEQLACDERIEDNAMVITMLPTPRLLPLLPGRFQPLSGLRSHPSRAVRNGKQRTEIYFPSGMTGAMPVSMGGARSFIMVLYRPPPPCIQPRLLHKFSITVQYYRPRKNQHPSTRLDLRVQKHLTSFAGIARVP